MRHILRWVLTMLAISTLVSLGSGFAQTTKGSIVGTVSDPSGAVISGATVTATLDGGGEPHSAITSQTGGYRIEQLTPGSYVLSVEVSGFAKENINNVEVHTSEVTTNNIRLQVASGVETLSVEALQNAIQMDTGELSKVIPLSSVRDLPYASLNAYALATTLPGVSMVSNRDTLTNGTNFSVNGLRPRANNFLIDGFDNNDNGIAGQAFQPANTEAIQEVTVLTNAYNAEFGRGGGSVSNATFRSGSNHFHGALWDQYTGAGLNALKSEEATSGLTRPAQFVDNIFGFRLGGPIMKNKLYFFGTSQWNQFVGAQNPPPLTIPTANGFNVLNALAPTNANVRLLLSGLGNVRGVGNPTLVPLGARPGCPDPCNVEFGEFTRPDKAQAPSREWTVRTDYNLAHDAIFVRYTDAYTKLSPDLFANPTALPSEDTQQAGPSRNLGVMWTHTFSPSAINELRFSAQQINFTFGPTAATAANPNANLPSITLANSTNVDWGGFSSLGGFPQGRGHKTYQLQDAVLLNKGAHSFKIGADLAILLVNDLVPFNANGSITVGDGGPCPTATDPKNECSDLANYVDGFLGPSGALARVFGNPNASVPTSQQAFYFQDSWKFKPNLTLNYGVRYEYQPWDASNSLQFPALDPKTLGSEAFGTVHRVEPDRNNFGPRFGFSYSPHFLPGLFGNDATVIRGGYGLYYDTFYTNLSDNVLASAPNAPGFNINGGDGRGPTDLLATVAGASATSDPFATMQSVNSHLRNPLTHQWNLNLQRELPLKLTAEIAYVGTRGERLFTQSELNPKIPSGNKDAAGPRIIPTRGAIDLYTNSGDSIYHGLQTQLTRNFGNLSFRAAYTWSRSIDNQSAEFATSGGSAFFSQGFNPRSDRGPSVFNRTHVANFSYVYQVPFPKDKGILSQILGGWGTSGILNFTSGVPENVYLGSYDQNGDGHSFSDRPDSGNPNAKVNFSAACLRNPNCFTGVGLNDGSGNLVDYKHQLLHGTVNDFKYILFLRNSGHNGNLTRNTVTYPGQYQWDTSLLKSFSMPHLEGHAIEFRADLFDVLNHRNLGVNGFNGNLNSGNFLNLDSTRRGGRTIALWLKYSF